ncbi:MAG TPA: diacylglycerol kinase family protein [Rhizomicrobium sp.]|jgi:diacylglycerol kinase family enzyme|nr:diacylglycerol kinase family protein [Rhizomicrobium sp.]
MTAFVVFNPNSAGGRTGRDWQQIEAALERVFPLMSFFVTSAPGQAAHMVRDALRDGHMEIVAVGSDGTINEALNGFFERGQAVSPDAVFSFVHNGNDGALCRRFGIAPGWQAGIAHLGKARVRKADVGRVTCLSADGRPAIRHFLGSASIGLSAEIARRMGAARIARLFGHRFARALHAGIARLGWRARRVRLIAGDADEIAGIANVRLAPREGEFDLAVLQGGQPLTGAPRLMRSARLTAAPTLDTSGRVAVETDGESAGVLPASFEILPAALNLRA